MFHDHILEFSLKPIIIPNQEYLRKLQEDIDFIKNKNRTYLTDTTKCRKYVNTNSNLYSDYDDIIMPVFDKHRNNHDLFLKKWS